MLSGFDSKKSPSLSANAVTVKVKGGEDVKNG